MGLYRGLLQGILGFETLAANGSFPEVPLV